MPDFSTILQAPEVRSLVQENLLERAFHDALYPRLLFRGEAMPQQWPLNVGDTMVFTGSGLITPKQKPLTPGSDPGPSSYQSEQWEATLQQYADSIDTHMPTSISAIADLFLRNAHQLGLSAGQTLNRIVRNRLFNAAMAGHTVADGAQGPLTTIRVARLNGFTKARRPDLTLGSPVRYSTVSVNNPLAVTVHESGTPAARTVVGFTPDNTGDELGPGTITLNAAVTVIDRDPILADDKTSLVRVGGGDAVDAVGSADLLRLQDIRTAVARFWQQNVPEMPDGRFHCHLDPTSQAQVFSDTEWQRLLTSLPDYYMYKQFAIGELLNCVFFRNSENPIPETVDGGGLTGTFTEDDPFGGELRSDGTATGVVIHRPLFVAQGSIYEYHQDLSALITEAGITGKVGEASISNNGIEVYTDRIQLIIRSPLNRLQDLVSTSWKFIGDWPVRTDVTSGDGARFKRLQVIEHGA
jgi:hypothetical protein